MSSFHTLSFPDYEIDSAFLFSSGESVINCVNEMQYMQDKPQAEIDEKLKTVFPRFFELWKKMIHIKRGRQDVRGLTCFYVICNRICELIVTRDLMTEKLFEPMYSKAIETMDIVNNTIIAAYNERIQRFFTNEIRDAKIRGLAVIETLKVVESSNRMALQPHIDLLQNFILDALRDVCFSAEEKAKIENIAPLCHVALHLDKTFARNFLSQASLMENLSKSVSTFKALLLEVKKRFNHLLHLIRQASDALIEIQGIDAWNQFKLERIGGEQRFSDILFNNKESLWKILTYFPAEGDDILLSLEKGTMHFKDTMTMTEDQKLEVTIIQLDLLATTIVADTSEMKGHMGLIPVLSQLSIQKNIMITKVNALANLFHHTYRHATNQHHGSRISTRTILTHYVGEWEQVEKSVETLKIPPKQEVITKINKPFRDATLVLDHLEKHPLEQMDLPRLRNLFRDLNILWVNAHTQLCEAFNNHVFEPEPACVCDGCSKPWNVVFADDALDVLVDKVIDDFTQKRIVKKTAITRIKDFLATYPNHRGARAFLLSLQDEEISDEEEDHPHHHHKKKNKKKKTPTPKTVVVASSSRPSLPTPLEDEEIPEEFCCPISLVLMTDPVLCSDGRTYEREEIEQWMKVNPTSPFSREKVNILISDTEKFQAIRLWKMVVPSRLLKI
jgi:hypothetical protein